MLFFPKALFLSVLVLTAVVVNAGTESSTYEEPDVHRAYCGKQTPYAFCLCAFQNQGCEVMGVTQSEGKSMVETGFREWVGKQIEEVAKSCIDGGGHWNASTRQCITCTEGDVRSENKCVSPEKAANTAEGKFCSNLKDFSDDWESYTDFESAASETDTSDQVRLYYESSKSLADKLSKRQSDFFDQTVDTVLLSHLDAYKTALEDEKEVEISQKLAAFYWYINTSPSKFRTPLKFLFETEEDSLLPIFDAFKSSVPRDSVMSSFDRAKMEEGLYDLFWDTPYPQILGYGDGNGVANQNFTPRPDSFLAAVDNDAIALLQKTHLNSLRLDKTKAEISARRSQSRVSALLALPAIAKNYNEMELHKKDEYERVYDQISSSCNQ